jgi:hypothetical protein
MVAGLSAFLIASGWSGVHGHHAGRVVSYRVASRTRLVDFPKRRITTDHITDPLHSFALKGQLSNSEHLSLFTFLYEYNQT